MARVEMVVIAFGLVMVAGLVIAFASLTEGVNQDADDLARKNVEAQQSLSAGSDPRSTAEASPEPSPPADIVAPTVNAGAPVVIGSVSMLTNTAREYVQLDVSTCTPGAGSIDVRLGTIILEMHGRDGSDCLLDYGTNIENTNPDGALTATCRVPARLGKLKLTTREDGADFSPIEQYCSDN